MPKKILMIEDEAILLDTTAMFLEGLGYEVLKATDGVHGLNLALDQKPDLILLDFTLPGMHGLDVASKLAENEETNQIPILFLTGSEDFENRLNKLENVAGQKMDKPFDLEALAEEIDKTIGA